MMERKVLRGVAGLAGARGLGFPGLPEAEIDGGEQGGRPPAGAGPSTQTSFSSITFHTAPRVF
jgi:hypothetical protein